MKEITETLRVPVKERVDVIVAGGGFAGVAAALAARRCGAEVLLLEKTALLGGLGTNGLISWYEPLCDGLGEQMITGIAEELLHAAIRYGDDTLPEAWREYAAGAREGGADRGRLAEKRYATFFSPTMCQLAMDEVLAGAGVRIRLDILAARPVTEGARVLGIMCESKSGREFFPADAFVDATGDADLFARAGCECVQGKNYFTAIAHLCRAAGKAKAMQNREWIAEGANLFGAGHPEGYPLMAGTANEEVTRFLLDGRKAILERVRGDDRTARDIMALPAQAQFRETRRIKGAATVTEGDRMKPQPDSIGLTGDFKRPGEWYEIPCGCLYSPQAENMFAAGRMISAEGWAWEVTRLIPCCALTGQAAGTAAALLAREKCTAAALPVPRLQESLRRQGVRLHR